MDLGLLTAQPPLVNPHCPCPVSPGTCFSCRLLGPRESHLPCVAASPLHPLSLCEPDFQAHLARPSSRRSPASARLSQPPLILLPLHTVEEPLPGQFKEATPRATAVLNLAAWRGAAEVRRGRCRASSKRSPKGCRGHCILRPPALPSAASPRSAGSKWQITLLQKGVAMLLAFVFSSKDSGGGCGRCQRVIPVEKR